MPKYSYLNLIKRQAKRHAHAQSLKLSTAQEQLSHKFGFTDFHELTTVAKRIPTDPRLMNAALETRNLGELLEGDSILQTLDAEVEDALSGVIAETNAYAFMVEDLDVVDSGYDASTGTAQFTVAFSYVGEQDPDKVYHGTTFYVDAYIRLKRRSELWHLCDEDGLEIVTCERDVDRDYSAEHVAGRLE